MGTPVVLNWVPVSRGCRAGNLSLYVRGGGKHGLCPGNQRKNGASPPKRVSRQTVAIAPPSLLCPLYFLLPVPHPVFQPTAAREVFSKCTSNIVTPPFEILCPPPSTWSWDKGQMPNMVYRVPPDLLSSPPSTSLVNFLFLPSPLISSRERRLALVSLASAWNSRLLLATGSFADAHTPPITF